MAVSSAQSTYATTVDGIARLGGALARYGLAVAIGWIGLLKFTSFEAHGIQPLVANSPFISWMYEVALLGIAVGTLSDALRTSRVDSHV